MSNFRIELSLNNMSGFIEKEKEFFIRILYIKIFFSSFSSMPAPDFRGVIPATIISFQRFQI